MGSGLSTLSPPSPVALGSYPQVVNGCSLCSGHYYHDDFTCLGQYVVGSVFSCF